MVGCAAGSGFCTCLNWASALVRALECWAKVASFQGRFLLPAPRNWRPRVAGPFGADTPSGRGIDAAAVLGGEDLIRTTASSVTAWHGGSPLIREHLALRHLGPACGASQLPVFLAFDDLDA